jgi:hypothetical protein
MPLGAMVRQGDVYIERVEEPAVLAPYPGRQLAPGQAPGARHEVVGDATLFTFLGMTDPLVGPGILARDRFEIVHPEHAAIRLPAGCYRVRYQRRYRGEESAAQSWAALD